MSKDTIRIKNKALYRDSKGADNLAVLAHESLLTESRSVDVALAPGRGMRSIDAYSIVMAAEALGKSVIQVRSWIEKAFIPPPVLRVVNHGYSVYDSTEMEIIRDHLYRHTKTGISYLTDNSIEFVSELFKDIKKHRKANHGG